MVQLLNHLAARLLEHHAPLLDLLVHVAQLGGDLALVVELRDVVGVGVEGVADLAQLGLDVGGAEHDDEDELGHLAAGLRVSDGVVDLGEPEEGVAAGGAEDHALEAHLLRLRQDAGEVGEANAGVAAADALLLLHLGRELEELPGALQHELALDALVELARQALDVAVQRQKLLLTGRQHLLQLVQHRGCRLVLRLRVQGLEEALQVPHHLRARPRGSATAQTRGRGPSACAQGPRGLRRAPNRPRRCQTCPAPTGTGAACGPARRTA